jgi:chromosome segregation ATPase
MAELPENVDLQWLARHLVEFRRETRDELALMRADIRALRTDMDMLTRIVLRLDSTVNALREDIKSLWLNQGDLRRRIEALEERPQSP